MGPKLKKFRVEAGLTQAKLAAAVGVTQPNYQRWEAGTAPVPADKLKKLAKVLKATPEALLGRHPPINAKFYDDSEGDELNYYGEVAIHFLGGGDALLISISEAEYGRLHADLQSDRAFVHVESLANQLVILRAKAIADLYFSSEAYDDYGPEHGFYVGHIDSQIPDPRDWEIIESLAVDGVGLEDFDEANIDRVQEMVLITDQQYEKLVSDGLIKLDDLEEEKKKNQAKTDDIFDAAMNIKYQLSNGKIRKAHTAEDDNIYNAFYGLVEFGDDEDEKGMIRLSTDGYHRTIFIGKGNFDYIMIPSHKYKNGEIESAAESLDAFDD